MAKYGNIDLLNFQLEGTIRQLTQRATLTVKNNSQYNQTAEFYFEKRSIFGKVITGRDNTSIFNIPPGQTIRATKILYNSNDEKDTWKIASITVTGADGSSSSHAVNLSSGMIECFIATAVYKSPEHPKVQEFRRLRDEVLINSQSGREFIKWYNHNGPKFAELVEQIPGLRRAARAILTPTAVLLKALRRSGIISYGSIPKKTITHE